jgi:PPOX class probable F420-dependent enzyme
MDQHAPMDSRPTGVDRFITVATVVVAALTLVAGVWAIVAPASFADAVRFPPHEHFVHDVGAFQVGMGLTLLLALIWRDPRAVVLGGFLVGNTIHAVNHWVDLDQGGRASDPWLLAAVSIVFGVALALRLRQLHYVVGRVRPTSCTHLAPFVEQKTSLLTTFRRNGTPVPTPLSVVVDGDRAFFRSYEKAGKTKRLRNDTRVEVRPSTTRGKPLGPAVQAEARRLGGAEAQHAARLLARKHPLLHGIVVPFGHRVGRHRTGRTVHFEVTC